MGGACHAAGNGVSSSGAGAIKWRCQCISATGAGGAAGGRTAVVLLVVVEPHISGSRKVGGIARG